ncbi:phosphoenolpyruvate mutase [Lacrimispora sp.]|uniref:phosphoenolpyruvate mutase n=1 Tax=Lacrimispora sp. TaxID=2719234 RepID=UPI0028ABB01C|nr:phosphoenolpyruvate mutase [Lacrimispora sp.]
MKKVYTCFSTDIIHEGHLKILNEAKKYGKVIVGVLSDEASIKFDRFPSISFKERLHLISSLENVDEVVIQKEISYENILNEIKPNYVIHGDNWKKGPLQNIRLEVIELLNNWRGELIEIPYKFTEDMMELERNAKEMLAMPEYRRGRMRQLLEKRKITKAIEVHNGITGLIAEKTVIFNDKEVDQFDAMWVSSLCDSISKGKPDIELIDMSSRLKTIDEILDVTTKPIILDGDTGGLVEHFVYNVKTLERMGVSAIIIEDKIGLKKNSLFGVEANQNQDTIDNFCQKIRAGRNAIRDKSFMIIARIESLILKMGVEDALNRAFAYVKAGADGIMIHSKENTPDEIFDFCDKFREYDSVTPIVVVPTSYNKVTEEELYNHGVNIVIYANQLTRSAYPAMKKVAENILLNHSANVIDKELMSIANILSLIETL